MKVMFWTRDGRAMIFALRIEKESRRSIRFNTGCNEHITIKRDDIISIKKYDIRGIEL